MSTLVVIPADELKTLIKEAVTEALGQKTHVGEKEEVLFLRVAAYAKSRSYSERTG